MLRHKLRYLLAFFIVQISIFASSSQILEFCADNQLFSFSKQECPGGVLLKKPMELTEPCHCINKYLTAYSTCDYDAYMQSNFTNPMKVCRRFENGQRYRRGGVILRLLQPVGYAKNGSKKIRHNDFKCHNAHKKCKKIATNSASYAITKYKQAAEASQLPHWNKGNYNNNEQDHSDKFMQRHNHHRRQKRHTSITHVADAKLRERIQETMDLLNDLQSSSFDSIKPRSMSFQLLAKTVQIFNYITPNVIVENEIINSILAIFLKKYSVMELPGYSGRLIADDQVDEEMFENVIGSLEECESRASDSSQEFEFVTLRNSCPPDITHVVHKVNTLESGFRRRLRYELGHFMPSDRKYIPEMEDFILAALWKMFDAVYSYCFSAVFSYRTSQTLNNYFTIINNIFTSPWTVNDFLAERFQGTLMYSSRIEHENLTALMKNLDYMSEAVHILSRYKTFFKKPVSISSRLRRDPTFTDWTSTTTSESPIFSNRNKRSIREDHSVPLNWADLEIWEGRAYCLQISNPDLPTSIANTLPNVNELCAAISLPRDKL